MTDPTLDQPEDYERDVVNRRVLELVHEMQDVHRDLRASIAQADAALCGGAPVGVRAIASGQQHQRHRRTVMARTKAEVDSLLRREARAVHGLLLFLGALAFVPSFIVLFLFVC
jgi:hypothetical protein